LTWLTQKISFLVLGRAQSEELALVEFVEPWSTVVGAEVLEEDRDQQARLGEAVLGAGTCARRALTR
jgi:hypothetical protein